MFPRSLQKGHFSHFMARTEPRVWVYILGRWDCCDWERPDKIHPSVHFSELTWKSGGYPNKIGAEWILSAKIINNNYSSQQLRAS